MALALCCGGRGVAFSADLVCTGDCNNDGSITLADILTGITQIFDSAAIAHCSSFDSAPADGVVRANEITGAVLAAGICIPSTPAAAVAGDTAIVANALGVIPKVVAALVSGFVYGTPMAPLARGPSPQPQDCPLGGTALRIGTIPTVQVALDSCRVPAAGGSVTFQGAINLNLDSFTAFVVSTFEDAGGTPALTATADLSGTVGATLGGDCYVADAIITAVGRLSAATADGQMVSLATQRLDVAISDLVFSTNCAPVGYRLVINGVATLGSSAGNGANASFQDFVMTVDESVDPASLTLDGAFSSDCFGGAVTLATQMPIALPGGQICPVGGAVDATLTDGAARILYGADGSVQIDLGPDESVDEVFPQCLDPRLAMCPS